MAWVVQSTGALSHRQRPLGLPPAYLGLMIASAMMLVIIMDEIIPGIYVLVVGVGVGKAFAYFDPFALDLMALSLRIPRIMHP